MHHGRKPHGPKSRKRKFELVLPRVEALEALTRLTGPVPQGNLVIGEETVPLEDFTSLKVTLKNFGASSLLKVRLKYPALGVAALPSQAAMEAEDAAVEAAAAARPAEPEAEPEEAGKPRYKGLKKRMRHTFKAVLAALGAGMAPDMALLDEFIADCRLMTSFPGKGDAFYPAFDAEVDRLKAAALAGDMEAMIAAAAALDRMKKECHSRHA